MGGEFYEGRIFRPPSEANSLILQVTVGCAHNGCAFCGMYKEKAFRIKPLEEVLGHVALLAAKYPEVSRVFIADGDALVLPMPYWEALLKALKGQFKALERITSYGTPKDVLNKGPEALKALKAMGLEMVYLGLETGSEALLLEINKGSTAAEAVQAAAYLKAAGIKQSVTVISGLGGRKLSRSHAEETARTLNAMQPEYLGLLTLLLEEGTPLWEAARSGEMALLSPLEILMETRDLVAALELNDCHFRSNHASNYLPLGGHFPEEKEALLSLLDRVLADGTRVRAESARRL